MNFFKLYIGDYQRDTAHLSITEHGAFLLMLQHYYATEKPLPKGKALHRMLRAQDKSEREAIDSVSAQFWQETDEGLINERADEEIKKSSVQAETNKAIALAREAKRREQRQKNEQSTNRATNDQPNHNHSHNQTTVINNTVDNLTVPSVMPANPHQPAPDFENLPANVHPMTVKFKMHSEWEPGESFETLARVAGLVFGDKLPAKELGEFKTYWLTHAHQPMDQNQWEHKFIQNLLFQKARASK
jgi:uncharacterized protein YdaU (DUF1376 family)